MNNRVISFWAKVISVQGDENEEAVSGHEINCDILPVDKLALWSDGSTKHIPLAQKSVGGPLVTKNKFCQSVDADVTLQNEITLSNQMTFCQMIFSRITK